MGSQPHKLGIAESHRSSQKGGTVRRVPSSKKRSTILQPAWVVWPKMAVGVSAVFAPTLVSTSRSQERLALGAEN